MEPAGAPGVALDLQHLPGRRIPLSRGLAAKDERRLRTVGLGRERGCLWSVSSPSALGSAREYPARSAISFHGQALPQQLVPHPPALRAECLFHRSDPGTGSGGGVAKPGISQNQNSESLRKRLGVLFLPVAND